MEPFKQLINHKRNAINLTFKGKENYLYEWAKNKSSPAAFIKDLMKKVYDEEHKK